MFYKPKAIAYLRRNDLIVAGPDIPAAKLTIPAELVNNLEVDNPEAFVIACQDFFAARGLAGKRVLVVLDRSVVFYKQLELSDAKKATVAQATDAFVSAMPLAAGQRACLCLQSGNRLEFYATNARLYEYLREALKLADVHKLVAITPAAAYKLDSAMRPAEAIERYLSDRSTAEEADFSTAIVA